MVKRNYLMKYHFGDIAKAFYLDDGLRRANSPLEESSNEIMFF